MPYVITTERITPEKRAYERSDVIATRRAVATLEEARDATRTILAPKAYAGLADALTPSGGTIGPLPDGTVITVEPADDETLARGANVGRGVPDLVAAFNAAQEA